MPNYYEQPAAFQNAVVEDANKFQKLPFYLVKNEVKYFPQWNIFDQLFGEISWQTNMGNTMRAVTPQRSPVGKVFAFPNNIDVLPNKNVYSVSESSEDARVKAERFESQQFSFVPSFTDFWRDHIQFANRDIVRQIANYNNMFIQTNMLEKSPYVYVAGVGLLAAPTGAIGSTLIADAETLTAVNGKDSAFWAAQAAAVRTNLSLRVIYSAQLQHREDLGAPPFEGVKNMPADNEGVKGKTVLVGSTEAWDTFLFDPDTNLLKSLHEDLLFKDFAGSLFGKVAYKYNRYPMRLTADGTFVVPELYSDVQKKWLPNSNYNSLTYAPYEIAWLIGAESCKTIKVGPPPREFAAQSMSQHKFYSLKWNGEVRLTDQVLITYPDGTTDLNDYGTQLKLKAQATFGYMNGEPRFTFPILYRRMRPAVIV